MGPGRPEIFLRPTAHVWEHFLHISFIFHLFSFIFHSSSHSKRGIDTAARLSEIPGYISRQETQLEYIHTKMKRQQMRDRMRNIYWLVGKKSPLSLENERLLYVSTIKPIWTYGSQLWGRASKSNIENIQRPPPRYERKDDIHKDLRLGTM